MSRGVGRAIGLVAAIALPFAAPGIAAAMGLSTAVTGAATFLGAGKLAGAIGTTIGSGLVGAATGAANAALTGGNIGQGAIMGGLSAGMLGATGGGFKFGGYGKAAAGGAGAASAGSVSPVTAGMLPPTAATAAATPGVGAGVGTAVGANTAAGAAGAAGTAGATAGTAGQGAARTMLGKISQSLGNASPDIMQKAAVFLASNVLSGTSAKENALISQAAARMRDIERQDKGLYDMMLAEAQAINPQARGMQYYNDAQLQGIAAGEAAVEGMSPRNVDAKAEVSRRALQNASKNATLAYRQGYDSGETQRRSALGALGNTPQYNAASGILGLERTRRADQAANAADVRSSLGTIFTPDPGEANRPEEDNEDARTALGLGGG